MLLSCAGRVALRLGDLLAAAVNGRGRTVVIEDDHQVLLGVELRTSRPVVDRGLVVLASGRQTIAELEAIDVMQCEAVPACRLLRHPLDRLDAGEGNGKCSCHVSSISTLSSGQSR